MRYTPNRPRFLPLPFRLAALAGRRSGKGVGQGEGPLCLVYPMVLSIVLVRASGFFRR